VLWIRTMLMTIGLFPVLAGTIGLTITLVAWSYGALAAVPFTTMLWLAVIMLFVAVPLAFLGTIAGRHVCGGAARTRPQAPPRPVPPGPWYAQRWLLVAVGGLLPFGAAFVETYFVFAALWHYKLYYVYGFACLALLCVIAVAGCAAMVAVYIQLSAEDHSWPWTAFGCGAATGFYIFGYAVYYFVWRTRMSGLLQTLFFFGYTLLLCSVIALICGMSQMIVCVINLCQRNGCVWCSNIVCASIVCEQQRRMKSFCCYVQKSRIVFIKSFVHCFVLFSVLSDT